jgi:hypothetical protein
VYQFVSPSTQPFDPYSSCQKYVRSGNAGERLHYSTAVVPIHRDLVRWRHLERNAKICQMTTDANVSFTPWSNCDVVWSNCDVVWSNCDVVWSNCDVVWSNCDVVWSNCNVVWSFQSNAVGFSRGAVLTRSDAASGRQFGCSAYLGLNIAHVTLFFVSPPATARPTWPYVHACI